MNVLKTFFALLLLVTAFVCQSQQTEYPILTEKPKKGIYYSFEDFRNNEPTVEKFDVKAYPKTYGEWEDNLLFFPRKGTSDLPAKNIWGFSNGEGIYISFANSFFPLEIKDHKIFFNGFAKVKDLNDFAKLNQNVDKTIDKNLKIKYELNINNGIVKDLSKNIFDDLKAPKKGIFNTFLEFYYNRPQFTEPFKIGNKLRTKGVYKSSPSYYPYLENSNSDKEKKIDNIYGFSDGKDFFVFDQFEFYKVNLQDFSFDAHPRIEKYNNYGGGVTGAITSEIVKNQKFNKALKQKVTYYINPNNGLFSSARNGNLKVNFYIFRRKNKKSELAQSFLINGENCVLNASDYIVLNVPMSNKNLELCFDETKLDCVTYPLNFPKDFYIEFSCKDAENPKFVYYSELQGKHAFNAVKIEKEYLKNVEKMKAAKKEKKQNKQK